MTERTPEEQSAAVSERTRRDEEIRLRWQWVELAIWTPRMLAALEQGVKGGNWYSLMDKVYKVENLTSGFRKVEANKGSAGVDHVTVEMFGDRWIENLQHLSEQLASGQYRPQPIRRVWIPKPGTKEMRPLGIPTVRDRVVQAALRNAIEPIFEREFAAQSYGFRPGRGCKDALRRVDGLLKAGYEWIVDVDLKSYFDTIPHEQLLARIRERVADSKVLDLITAFLKQGVMGGLAGWTPETGTPQGAVISPLLSNIYLNPLDHQMANRGTEMVRYADDLVLVCRSQAEAEEALAVLTAWVTKSGLQLHPTKTRIVHTDDPGGFEFLGYHFVRGRRWPRKKSLTKLKDSVRANTKRTDGRSLSAIIKTLNPTLRGWYQYFKHCYRTTFRNIDRWVRGRLRSILRRRAGRRGRGRGEDHHRWPNAFFRKQGLYSLVTAHAQECRSSPR